MDIFTAPDIETALKVAMPQDIVRRVDLGPMPVHGHVQVFF